MKGHVISLGQATRENKDYRRVIFTTKNTQLVVMCLKPGEEIGEEVHHLDQFIFFEEGEATVVLNGVKDLALAEDAVIIPQGVKHNIINTGPTDLKLYTVYSPPEHKDGVVEKTKADEYEEHFDGKTTEI